jgi:3-dehydroquinate synthase
MTVKHAHGNYDIHFAHSANVPSFIPPGAAVITDSKVQGIFRDWLGDNPVFAMPPGEEQKNLARFGDALEWLASIKFSRSGTLVALGGGVVGDLAGFVASAYMRGVRYIQIPTTLLAQVDSSVGGKVGVDLPQGKNLAGAFYPPEKVVVCVEALTSLDSKQFINGMAEVWKYGFIGDAELVTELTEMQIQPNHPQLESIVRRCIRHKRDVVEQDEHETAGLRATLNFGHTVGHAIEQATEYREYLHGEAISIGMMVETKLGEALGITDKGTLEQVRDGLFRQGLPLTADILRDTDRLIDVMKRDKKAKAGQLAFSLLTKIGECKLIESVPEKDVASALKDS